MSNRGYRAQEGFSLVEIVVVLVIIAILATFAFLALGNSAENLDRQNVARSFKVALERARFDSVKRRPATCADQARVEITSPTSFSVITDQDQDGTLDAETETRTVDFGGRGNTNIVTPDLDETVVYRFDARGQVSSGPCDAQVEIPSTVTFCQMPCVTPDDTNSSVIFISPTGTAAYLTGGSTVPTFSDPTLGNVSTSMNPMLAVWDLITGNSNSNGNTNSNSNTNTNINTNVNTNINTNINTNVNANVNTNTHTNTNTNTNSNTNTNPPTNTNTTPTYCENNTPPVGCVCGPNQHMQAGKCRRNH